MQGALAVKSPVGIAGDRRARCVFHSPARLLSSKGAPAAQTPRRSSALTSSGGVPQSRRAFVGHLALGALAAGATPRSLRRRSSSSGTGWERSLRGCGGLGS